VKESSLFDAGDYRQTVDADQATSTSDEQLSEELTLDIDRTLLRGDDGHPARKVSLHSLDKAHYAHYYADIVGTGMKNHGPLAWVELFAGPGKLFVREEARFYPGSPVQAVGINDPFEHYVFADLDPRCVAALDARIGHLPHVHVLEGDANKSDLHDRILALVPRDALVVLYADPAGLDLDFETLRFFAERYNRLDLLLNFPVPGIDRALSAKQAAKVGRVLNHPSPLELIAPGAARSRTSVREYFERQLRALGYDHFESQPIKSASKNSALYDIMLASRAERARRFFQEAKKRGPHGQRTFDLGV
jgi:three-Cys-motif partner protein